MVIGGGPNTTPQQAAQNLNAVQPMFYCPSRRPAALYGGLDYGGSGFWPPVNAVPTSTNLSAKSDYAANGGSVGFNEMGGPFPPNAHVELPNDFDTNGLQPQSSLAATVPLVPMPTFTWYLTPIAQPAPGGKAKPGNFAKNKIASVSFTGVIWYRSQVSLRQISDGTSKVYMIGEKYLDQFTALHMGTTGGNGDECAVYTGMCAGLIRLAGSGGIWNATNVPSAVTSAVGAPPIDTYNYPPMQDAPLWPGEYASGLSGPAGAPPGVLQDWGATMRFGSSHAGGFNMAFCDGSVHTIIYEIDPQVHLMLSDRGDGQTPDASSYLGQ